MSRTDLFVMGLLKDKPMYGYEIGQIMEEWHMDRWSKITLPAVYYALNKLEREGMLSKTCHMEGHLEQKIYSLTAKGEKTFLAALKKELGSPETLYQEYNVSLIFLKHLSTNEIRKALEPRRKFLQDRLQEHEECMAARESHPPYRRAAGDHGITFYRSELQWLENLLAKLEDEDSDAETPVGQDALRPPKKVGSQTARK